MALLLSLTTSLCAQINVFSSADSGPGSLRQAVAASTPGDTIRFDAALSGASINLSGSALVVSHDLWIDASALSSIDIKNAATNRRVFLVLDGEVRFTGLSFRDNTLYPDTNTALPGGCVLGIGPLASVKLETCRFENNFTGRYDGDTSRGGTIYSFGRLEIEQCIFENNAMDNPLQAAEGGVIYSEGPLFVRDSKFELNTIFTDGLASTARGGAIASRATDSLLLERSVFLTNSLLTFGSRGEGGAVFSEGPVYVNACSFVNNTIESTFNSFGGGIYADNTAAIDRSTFSGNRVESVVAAQGGGICVVGNLNLRRSTLVLNVADGEGDSSTDGGGAICYGMFTFSGNLFADNAGLFGPNIGFGSGNRVSNGYNLLSSTGDWPYSPGTGDVIDVPGAYAPLDTINGLLVHPLLPCSPAQDAGNPADFTADQVGQTPLGTVRDIGAFESNEVFVNPLVVVSTGDAGCGSLRFAIGVAQDGDVITFDPALNGDTIRIDGGAITVQKNITIQGPGADQLALKSSNGALYISDSTRVRIRDLSFSNCTKTSGSITEGGAIINAGWLTLEDVVFSDNLAQGPSGARGGAIYSIGLGSGVLDSLIIRRCRFSRNEARGSGGTASGGAIATDNSVLIIEDAFFERNRAVSNSSGSAHGGGVASAGPLHLEGSTFYRNRVTTLVGSARNGAISCAGTASQLIDRCTISGNVCFSSLGGAARGGALGTLGGTAPGMTILRSTIVNNRISGGDAFGAVVYNCCTTPTVMAHCLVAYNTANGDEEKFSWGTVTSNGYNHLRVGPCSGSGCGGLTWADGDQRGFTAAFPFEVFVDTNLTFGSGAVPYHELLCESPSIDAGDTADTAPDQLGQLPVGHARDIGAHESPFNKFLVNNTNDAGCGSLRDAIDAADNLPFGSAIDIRFAPFLAGDSIVLTSGPIDVQAQVRIKGLGADQLTISGGGTTRIFTVPDDAGIFRIDSVRIANGISTNPASLVFEDGGAIYNDGATIILSDCVVERNGVRAPSGFARGGFLYNVNRFEAYRTEFRNNFIDAGQAFGGVIYNAGGDVTLEDCRFHHNRVDALENGTGSVVYNRVWSDMWIRRSTLDSNTSTSIGGVLDAGAIFSEADLELDRVTLSGNRIIGGASSSFGAAVRQEDGGNLNIYRSTIVNNSATGTGNVRGGGISSVRPTTMESTVVANNTASNGDPDLHGTGSYNTNGYNAIGNRGGVSWPGGGTGDVIGTSGSPLDLEFLPLAFNGGIGPTHGVPSSCPQSPLINGGNPGDAQVDQTGAPLRWPPRDIGAYDNNLFSVAELQADNNTEIVQVSWDAFCDQPNITGIRVFRNLAASSVSGTLSPSTIDWNDLTPIPGVFVPYCVKTVDGSRLSADSCTVGRGKADGVISGLVASSGSGAPIPEVEVCAIAENQAALVLDGVDDWVQSASPVLLSDSGSVAVWLYADDWNTMPFRGVFAKGGTDSVPGALQAGFSAAAGVELRFGGIGEAGAVVLNHIDTLLADTGWHHLAVSWGPDAGGTRVRLFWDEDLVDDALAMASVAGESLVRIGVDGNNRYWKGRLDEWQYRNIPLDTAVEGLSTNLPLSDAPGLVWVHRFEPVVLFGEALAADFATDGRRHARLLGGAATTAGSGYPMRHCATTNASGSYSILEVPYAPNTMGTSYTVAPTTEGRGYLPGSRVVDLVPGTGTNISAGNVFLDTTSFTLQGTVATAPFFFPGSGTVDPGCRLDSVEIVVTGGPFGAPPVPSVFTDSAGRYTVAVPEPGNWILTPVYNDHGFAPAARTVAVASNLDLLNFQDTTRRRLTGFFRGSCSTGVPSNPFNRFTDGVTIRIASEETNPSACIDLTYTTGLNNQWDLELPPFTYRVSLLEIFPEGSTTPDGDLLNRMNQLLRDERSVDLRMADDSAQFLYKTEPELSVSLIGEEALLGDPSAPVDACAIPLDTFRRIQQIDTDTLDLAIEQVYVYNGVETRCAYIPEDNAVVNINDPVSGFSDTVSLDANGEGLYVVVARNVNTVVGSLPIPYAWLFAAQAEADIDLSDPVEQIVVVEGFRASGASFVTKSPQLPLMILRDPPGDGSFSKLLQDTTICNGETWSIQNSSDTTDYATLRLGAAFSIGLGGSVGLGAEVDWSVSTNVAVWYDQSSEFSVGGRTTGQGSREKCISSFREYQTETSDQLTGNQGDLFIGAAYVMAYTVADDIAYSSDSCKLVKSRSLSIAPDSMATQYVFSRFQIETQQLPKLDSIVANTPLLPDGSLSQESRNLLNQKDVWLQALAEADDLANQALALADTNFAFDGGVGPITRGITFESFGQSEILFDVFLDTLITNELGFDFAGTGLWGGERIRINSFTSEGTTKSTTTSSTISYTLDDDDPGDEFSVTVGTDPVHGTPVFDLVGGQSSCPTEPGTTIRDDATMTVIGLSSVTVPLPWPIPPVADFPLDISNVSLSLTDPSRDYLVDLIENTEGAIVRVDGSDIGTGSANINAVPTGGTRSTTLTVEKGSTAFEYTNIRVGLYPQDCPDELLDEVVVNVRFDSPCADVELTAPNPGWTVNALDGNQLVLEITDFATGDLTEVRFQYRLADGGAWTTFHTVPAAVLAGAGTFYNYTWDVSGFEDAAYELRARVQCPGGYTLSNVSAGLMDRSSLQVVSTVPAEGGVLAFGAIPSVTFNEDLACAGVDLNNASAVFSANDSTVFLENPVCGPGGLLTLPIRTALTSDCALENEWVTFKVFGLTDQFGNPIDTVVWTFYVDRFADPALGLSGTSPSAIGSSDGSVDLTVTGGFPPYTFSWSNGATSEDLSGLAAGTYVVTVEDAQCSSVTDSVTITDPVSGLSGTDACVDATPVGPGVYPFSTIGAIGPDVSSCGVTDDNSIWFLYTPTSSGTALMHTCGSAVNTVLSVRGSCSGGAPDLLCNDDDVANLVCGGTASALEVPITAGLSFYIRVAGNNGAEGLGTLTIEEPAATCSSATPPQNPRHTVEATRIRMQWDPVPQSVACDLRGERLSPSPQSGRVTLNGLEVSDRAVPFSTLGAGTQWRFRVRCACSISPVDATGFSDWDTFSVPALQRLQPMPKAVNVYPNPATTSVLVDLQGFEEQRVELRITGLDGRVLHVERLVVGTNWENHRVEVSGLPAGLYQLSVRDAAGVHSQRFTKLEQ